MQGKPREIINWLYDQSKDKEFVIKEFHQKRSLSANSYCWVLIGQIADIIGKTKEDVYRDYIKNKGIYRIITMNKEAVPTFQKIWSERGLGWISETMETKIEGLVDVIAYYGTSSYNTKQMANFVDYVVQEAKQLEIPTKDDYEIEGLVKEWNND